MTVAVAKVPEANRIRLFVVFFAVGLTLAGAIFTPTFQLPLIAVNVVWSFIFAVPVALAYGLRGGLLVGLLGVAPVPFMLWHNNGWANLAGAGQYVFWLAWLGWCSDRRREGAGIWSYPPVAQLAMLPVHALVFLVLFPLLLPLNPPPWEAETVSSVPAEILRGVMIKDVFALYFCLLGGMCLLKLPKIRHVFGLRTPQTFRLNVAILSTALGAFFLLWVVLVALDGFLIGGHLPSSLPWPESPYEIVGLFVILNACLATALAICDFSEHNLETAARLKASKTSLGATLTQLRATNVELERMTMVAAHDLQEPVRTVVSFSQLLEQRYKGLLDGPGIDYLRYLVEGAKRMRELVNGLHDYSRLLHRTCAEENVPMRRLLDEEVARLKGAFPQVVLRIDVANAPSVVGDREMLRQLLGHLLENAIKFRQEGTLADMRFGARDTGQGFWEFSLADAGIGIPQEYRSKVFEAFRQLTPVGRFPGVGIGLALARLIVQRHGGRIWVAKGDPGDTELRFTLPQADVGGSRKGAAEKEEDAEVSIRPLARDTA